MSADLRAAPSAVLLSYDVSGAARTTAVRVCHLVFGRGDASAGSPRPFILRPGVVWVGQSVLILPRATAEDLAARLRDLGATVSLAPVAVRPEDLAAFRRRPAGATARGAP